MATHESTGVIEALSDALWRDERIFSERERELLSQVLRNAARNGNATEAENAAVASRIASAVSETIAQRIVEAAGSAIAPRLLEECSARLNGNGASTAHAESDHATMGPGPRPPKAAGPGPRPPKAVEAVTTAAGPGPRPPKAFEAATTYAGPGPRPPKGFATATILAGPGPRPPRQGGPGGPKNPGAPQTGPGGPKNPGTPQRGPGGPKNPGPAPQRGGPGGPRNPGTPQRGPGGPRHGHNYSASEAQVLAGARLAGDAPVLVLDEFLAPQELERLARFVAEHESDFVLSEVVAPGVPAGMVDFEHRKSRVLYDLDEHEAVISGRILSCLPRVLPALGLAPFPISHVEAQITASNHGDFFRPHEDNTEAPLQTRELTFVYFFHREPKPFQGGELRIYDSRDGSGGYRAIVPQQNQIVFFPSHLLHEITPVNCASGAFTDSRFTLNGWFHRPE